MNDNEKTKSQLIDELNELRTIISDLKASETKLKETEAALREEAIRRRMLVEQSRDGIVILTEDGSVFEANQKYAEMLGYTIEETYKLHLWDWDALFSKEEMLQMTANIDEKGAFCETKHRRKDGSVYDVEISINGTICGDKKLILCVCRDITERKRNAEKLRESEERLSTFLNNFPAIAYQVPIHDIVAFKPDIFRGAVERITGIPAEEFINNKKWDELVHPDDIDRLHMVRKRFDTYTGYNSDIEYRIMRPNEEIRWVKDLAQVVHIGKENMIHGTIFDITERKLAEEEKLKLEEQVRHSQKLEAIGTLAGGIAHDFNNILSVIVGYTDLVLDEISYNNSSCLKLQAIKKAGDRAKDIVKQLLTFSRKAGPSKRPTDVVPIIKEALSFLRSTLPATIKITLDVDIADEFIMADPTQIHQVMMNLCVNSAQAMEARGGTIAVKAESIELNTELRDTFNKLPKGRYIKVSVEDTGPGISADIIDRIFDPYFTTREVGKGTGMGLSVVHGIVEEHGGAITVKSEPGCGALFSFVLPIIGIKGIVNSTVSEKTPSGDETVLFLDDEDAIVQISKMILEQLGYTVLTAIDPFDALDIIRKEPDCCDLMITDMTMPGMTGDILFKEIKKIRKEIPVILCTGYNSHIDKESALELGFAGYLMKPINRFELACAIRSALGS